MLEAGCGLLSVSRKDPLVLKYTHLGVLPVTPPDAPRSCTVTKLQPHTREVQALFLDTSPSGGPTPTHPALLQAIPLVLIKASDERRRVVFQTPNELLINTDSARNLPSPQTGRD